MEIRLKKVAYKYGNLPIPGGGYVTGFLFSEREEGVLYCRTDIGGTYRYRVESETWSSLIPHVTMEDLSETFPIALAIDEEKPGSLYIACGVFRSESGMLAISEDYGESFRYERIPVRIHGNLNGRGTGERLWVEGNRLWFASQQEGLWHSCDCGKSWQKLEAMVENYLTFVTRLGRALVVGTAGVSTAGVSTAQVSDDTGASAVHQQVPLRGHSLYISYDEGATFLPLQVPASRVVEGCRYNGLVAQRWARDERYFYVTFASTGRNSYVLENGYSCDSGDCIDGHIVRYPIMEAGHGCQCADGVSGEGDLRMHGGCGDGSRCLDGLSDHGSRGLTFGDGGLRLGAMEEITPGSASDVKGVNQEQLQEGQMLEYGFSGISVSRQTPGLLVATTMVKKDGDSVFRSFDYGRTWQQVLFGLKEGKITFRAPYMYPECNGGRSLIHWLSDIKINPFCEEEAWFNTGTGVFRTKNLKADLVEFTDWCDGIEETVHLNVYSMPKGQVQVIDILGDLGGFAFEEMDKPCRNSFADAAGNRYITCINADFSDEHPEWLVVTPRGNWTGETLGGLILSGDQGRTFRRLPMPYGLTEELDEALHGIEKPNVNSGWVAMSPDGRNIVWSVARGIELPISRVVVSHDGGESFTCCKVYDCAGALKTEGKLKVFSDRCDSRLFYGFGESSQFYISHDCGETYREYALPEAFPKVEFGLIDCANRTEVRGETGRSGVFYLAVGAEGLWKLQYCAGEDSLTLVRLTAPGITVYRMGLGLGRPGGDYYTEPKAIYFNGILEGQYGFYCTFDACRSFERLNTGKQMYGEINSIDGDCRTFGRFFLATGSNGLKYGERLQ